MCQGKGQLCYCLAVALAGSDYNNIHGEGGTMTSVEVELSGSVSRHWVGLELAMQQPKIKIDTFSRSAHCRDSIEGT